MNKNGPKLGTVKTETNHWNEPPSCRCQKRTAILQLLLSPTLRAKRSLGSIRHACKNVLLCKYQWNTPAKFDENFLKIQILDCYFYS